MSTATILGLIVAGVAIGTFSGMVGIGGGILVIPMLMFFFGFEQARANGTSLAMLLPPIGIFAVTAYAQAGNVNWAFAGILAGGFAVGAFVGAKLVNAGVVNPDVLRVCFAMLLIYSAGRLLFRSGTPAMAGVETAALMAGSLASYLILRLIGRRAAPPTATRWGLVYRRKRQHGAEHDYEI